jgi:RNA polymerase sigma-70 factor, ECF subfamily
MAKPASPLKSGLGVDSGESSVALLERARQGDNEALNTLLQRHVASLERWARGRLPLKIRDLQDTADLVQETILHSLKHLTRFEYRRKGALALYFRTVLTNRIRAEYRRSRRHPMPVALESTHEDTASSPAEQAASNEAVARYRQALSKLKADERHAIVARMESDCGYSELARLLGKPSPDAARMFVTRALRRLVEEMNVGGTAEANPRQ